MKAGHINVARSIFDHPMFDDGKPLSQREAWLWLISNAAWRPMQVMVRNGRSQQLVSLERGQLTYSRSFLCKAWSWSSDKKVRTFLNRLERGHLVGLQTGQLQTVITICNYGVFQNGKSISGPAKGQQTGQQWASNGPEEEYIINIKRKKTLSAEGKEGEESKEPSHGSFLLFWETYPRQDAKKAAERAYAKVIKDALISESDLLAKTKAFAASKAAVPADERKFIPHASTWLNGGRYSEQDAKATEPLSADKLTDAEWLLYLKFNLHNWPEGLGAKPGMPGCRVPPHLLSAQEGPSRAAATPVVRCVRQQGSGGHDANLHTPSSKRLG